MNQYIKSNKSPTYLHSNTFLEIELDTLNLSTTSNKINILPENSSLIDLCNFNSFYRQFVEKSPTSSNTSFQKSIVPSSELHIDNSSNSQSDSSSYSNGMFVLKSNSTETNYRTTATVQISATCDKNLNISTLMSDSSVKSNVQQNSSNDICLSKDLSKIISNKEYDLSTSQLNESDNTFNYELSSFITKVEQISDIMSVDSIDLNSINNNNEDKQCLSSIQKPPRSSPILHRLLLSPAKSKKTLSHFDIQTSRNDTMENKTNENPNNKSPQYRPRHSSIFSSDMQLISSENNLNKSSTISRSSCRSPVYTRRPQQQRFKIMNTKYDIESLSFQPIALLSLDTNGNILPNNHQIENSFSNDRQEVNLSITVSNDNKRTLESSHSEQILIKRRYQKSIPTIVIQRHYCISYPENIQRCVDCQTIDSSDVTMHHAGCRFQYCRTLQYLGDDRYEIHGFTTSDKAKSQDIEYLIIPNSGGQPPLNFVNANYILIQISKVFCLMFSYEETQRTLQNEKQIIWKQCVPGWREVCDKCLTTLFNYHYMCKQCGHMICIECLNEFSQMTPDKRKKLKRTCTHQDSFCLSEFIPWNILTKLRSNCIDYLSKLRIDYSIKFYHSSRNENLSIFIKSLKMKRLYDIRDIQKTWSAVDCDYDSNIEFYCNGRLPVFNEWHSANAKCFFQRVWAASCPVLVKRVHHNLSKTLWQPNAFKVHMIDHRDTPALWDCETLEPIQTDDDILTRFWDGFERLDIRLKDQEHGGRSRILKLKDWPTKKDFASVFPTRLHDLMTNIPFGDYTRRSYRYNDVTYHGGVFNIVERLPACLVKPDLGPKLYIAYSQLNNQSSRKAGTTNLHIDVSDAVNVLVYVGIGGHGENGTDTEKELRQVETEILKSNIDEVQLQRLRNGERPGALWHLFRSDDAKKIREYISRTRRKIAGFDSIHDQTAYLEKEDLDNLKYESQVEPYPILQFLGDAIFIPSGAPHQVKNFHSCIKIAEDFVSPENLDRCLITTNEFRSLSKTHTNHADILQAKNILFYATRDALNSLSEYNESFSESSAFDILS